MIVLWRDSWLKPLSDFDVGSERCKYCDKSFADMDFVTACEFCEIGIMHGSCADRHIVSKHLEPLRAKIKAHRDKPLHDFQ